MSRDFDPTLYILPSRNANAPPYDREELGIIKKYKEQYLMATTAGERRQVIVGALCPELFNFWVISRRMSFDTLGKSQRVKDLLAYVRNTWRLQKSTRNKQPSFLVRTSDVVWDEMKNEVFAEIADLMGLEEADTRTEGWFDYRSKAIKHVIDRLDKDQLAKINAEVLRRKKEGNPEHIQRKMASRHLLKRLDDSSRKNFLEMGALSLTFVLTKNEKGVFNIQCHDIMPQLLGIRADSFEEQNDALVEQFQRSVFRYVEDLMAKKEGRTSKFGYSPTESYVQYIEIDRVTGFPKILPSFRECKEPKKVYEQVFRKYLCAQYEAATGSSRPVPYTALQENLRKYIDKEYLPKQWSFKDPRNITIEDIKQFFNHIWQRQQFRPLQDVFRFKNVVNRRRNGMIIKAPYPDRSTWSQNTMADESSGNTAPHTTARKTGGSNVASTPLGPHENVMTFDTLYTLSDSQRNQDTEVIAARGIEAISLTAPQLSEPNSLPVGALAETQSGTGQETDQLSQGHNNIQDIPRHSHWPQPYEPFYDASHDVSQMQRQEVAPHFIENMQMQREDDAPHSIQNTAIIETDFQGILDPALLNEEESRGARCEAEDSAAAGKSHVQVAHIDGTADTTPDVEGKSKGGGKKRTSDDQALEEAARWQVGPKRIRKTKVREN